MAVSMEEVFLGHLDSENPEEKIELTLHRGNHGSNLQVRSLRWAQGIGWFVQKTIILDEMQMKDFKRLLAQAPFGTHRPKRTEKITNLSQWRTRSNGTLG